MRCALVLKLVHLNFAQIEFKILCNRRGDYFVLRGYCKHFMNLIKLLLSCYYRVLGQHRCL